MLRIPKGGAPWLPADACLCILLQMDRFYPPSADGRRGANF